MCSVTFVIYIKSGHGKPCPYYIVIKKSEF